MILTFFLIIFLCMIIYFLCKNFYKNFSTSNRNIYMYWEGKEYKLIKILRELIILHSKKGKGYNIHLINKENLHNYVEHLPSCFDKMLLAHQADFVRVYVIKMNGGIWLDSDTLVIDKLDSLFELIEKKDGFLIKENNSILCNGIFGSKKNTQFMNKWYSEIIKIINHKNEHLDWTELGNILISKIIEQNPEYLSNYKIFNGLDTMYPVNWNECVMEFIEKPYDNYLNLIRKYQPLVVLVNSVYKHDMIESKSEDEIYNMKLPLNYFINKSLQNSKN
jgi:hypothetical protein